MTSNETSFALLKSIIAEDVDAYKARKQYQSPPHIPLRWMDNETEQSFHTIGLQSYQSKIHQMIDCDGDW